MKLAITTSAPDIQKGIPVSLLSGDFITRILKAAEFGYDGVELIVNDPDRLDAKMILSSISEVGLEVAAISTGGLAFLENITIMSPSIEVRQQASARLEKIITFAHQVHTTIVTIGSFRGRTQPTSQLSDCANLKDILRHCAEHAGKNDVRLVLEPLNRYESNFINNVEEALQFIDEVGSANLGILIDTYHANIEERSMTECFLAANNTHKLWHTHLGDSNRFPTGQGHIDFPGIFRTLNDIHYEGYLSAELLSHPDPDKAAALTVEYCRPYLVS